MAEVYRKAKEVTGKVSKWSFPCKEQIVTKKLLSKYLGITCKWVSMYLYVEKFHLYLSELILCSAFPLWLELIMFWCKGF